MRRRELLFAAKNETGEGTTLDVLFSTNDGSSLKIFSPGEWPSENQYTPIGIVVVPASHNRYGDGSCGVMSLKTMSIVSPTEGETTGSAIKWGQSVNISNNIFNSYTALTSSYNQIPYQKYNFQTSSSTSNAVVWPYAGEATALTSSASTTYSNTGGYVQATSGLAACDFNGIRNTAAIYVKTKAYTQWTDSSIKYSAVTPAAACCARYKTIGTKAFIDIYSGITSNNINYGTSASTKSNTGYWYMPALGEITYYSSKVYDLKKTTQTLNAKYSNVAKEFDPDYYLSSTQNNTDKCWELSFQDVAGKLSTFFKTNEARPIRAFMRHYEPLTIDGYQAVDFGLPSGLKWAKYNVGANTETDYGLYFQWGDSQGYTADQVGSSEGQKYFGWADYKYGNGTSNLDENGMTKYNLTDEKTSLDAEDDAATVNMGGGWRMPTQGEINELITYTTASITTVNGVSGIYLSSKYGYPGYLFFPFNGYCYNGRFIKEDLDDSYDLGYNHSKTLGTDYLTNIICSTSDDSKKIATAYKNRCIGACVRGVHA